MVFNATFNNSSVILWRSVLLVEETYHRRKASSCKTNYHTITITVITSSRPTEREGQLGRRPVAHEFIINGSDK